MVRRGNLYILLILINQLLVMSMIVIFKPDIPQSPYSMAGFIAVTQLLCFVPPLLLYGLIVKPKALFKSSYATSGTKFFSGLPEKNQKSLLSFKPISLMNALLVFLMCLVIQPAMLMLSAISMFFFTNPVGDVLSGLSSTPLPVILFIMAVMPAFLEEITMRGVVLQNYAGLPIKKAAIANGVLFAILHLNPQQFLYAMLLGIIFAYYMHYTESLWAPILGHFTINATQIIIGSVGAKMIEAMPAESQSMLEDPSMNSIVIASIFLFVVSIIFLPVFVILFRSFIELNKHRIRHVDSSHDKTEICQETVSIDTLCVKTTAPNTQETPPEQGSAKVVDWAFIAVIVFYVSYVTLSFMIET